ncbi:hypothetical protein NDU88_004633 [Pleurodeles waltl]|uniref:Uncharacterized protein n=1 Tax=Pleurodeles waltl TaxID=8319 RepID=A0AAV7SJC4_PLEWA|nr:hypothetical protein NDU88_004633 [Pleurodeles waltl]
MGTWRLRNSAFVSFWFPARRAHGEEQQSRVRVREASPPDELSLRPSVHGRVCGWVPCGTEQGPESPRVSVLNILSVWPWAEAVQALHQGRRVLALCPFWGSNGAVAFGVLRRDAEKRSSIYDEAVPLSPSTVGEILFMSPVQLRAWGASKGPLLARKRQQSSGEGGSIVPGQPVVDKPGSGRLRLALPVRRPQRGRRLVLFSGRRRRNHPREPGHPGSRGNKKRGRTARRCGGGGRGRTRKGRERRKHRRSGRESGRRQETQEQRGSQRSSRARKKGEERTRAYNPPHPRRDMADEGTVLFKGQP